MDLKNAKIFCIFAHPDDESYIVGGTIALAARQGADITVISVTRGDKGFQHVRNQEEKERLTEIREQEMKNAANILGVKAIILWDYPDGGLNDLGEREQELIERLKEVINKKQPDMILTFGPDGVSGHRDHIAIGGYAVQVGREMSIPVYGITYPKELYIYLKPVLTARNKTKGHFKEHNELYELEPAQSEVDRVDISEVVDIKFEACRAHKTQNPEGLIQAWVVQSETLWKFEYFLPYGTKS